MEPFLPEKLERIDGLGEQVFAEQLRQTEAYLTEAQSKKDGLSTPEQVADHARGQRAMFLDAIGGLPEERCDLNPQWSPAIQRDHYHVERVIYQSLPDCPVTANLYLPDGEDGPVPAVIVAAGHAREAKIAYQNLARLLASHGIAALAIDPPGQGERMQLIDRQSGAQLCHWGTAEHGYIGLACTAWGMNLARYFVWDLMRGLDLLTTRSEIDPNRIGCAGNSGGGTQTCHMMLLEDRLAAAAPSCYLTDRLSYMRRYHAHDAEQNYFGHIPAGFNYDDFVIAFAPRPVLLAGTEDDFFPVDGLRQTYASAQRIYGLLDSQANCRLSIDEGKHGLRAFNQRAMRDFFLEVLAKQPDREKFDEPDEPIDEQSLGCTRSGQVLVDYPEVPTLLQRAARPPGNQSRLAGQALVGRVRELVTAPRTACELQPQITMETTNGWDWQIDHILLTSEPGITLSAAFVRPASHQPKPMPATLVVGDDIIPALRRDQTILRVLRRWTSGRAMLFLDARAGGSIAPPRISEHVDNQAFYGSLSLLAYNAWMLGDNLAAQRAYDVQRGLKYLRTRADVLSDDIQLHSEGQMALPGLLASISDGAIGHASLFDLPRSYAQAFASGGYDRRLINEWTVIHGMLKTFDTPDLLSALREVHGCPVSESRWESADGPAPGFDH